MPETMSSSRKSKVGQTGRWEATAAGGGGGGVDTSREAQTHARPMWCAVPRNVYIIRAPSWPANTSGCLCGMKRPSACPYTSAARVLSGFIPPHTPTTTTSRSTATWHTAGGGTVKTENKWSTVSNRSHILMETSFCQVSDWLSTQIV